MQWNLASMDPGRYILKLSILTQPIQVMPFPLSLSLSLLLHHHHHHHPYVWQDVYEETKAYSQPSQTFVAQNPDITDVFSFSTELWFCLSECVNSYACGLLQILMLNEESLHPQKLGCGALCRCCIIGYISFQYSHNTGVYLSICYKCMHQLEDHELGFRNFQ